MTQPAALARFGLSSGRWLLPLVPVLLVSAILALAMNSALHGGILAMDQRHDVELTEPTSQASGAVSRKQSTASVSAASTDQASSIGPSPCTAVDGGAMHVGLDWWIVAEGQNFACESGKP